MHKIFLEFLVVKKAAINRICVQTMMFLALIVLNMIHCYRNMQKLVAYIELKNPQVQLSGLGKYLVATLISNVYWKLDCL